MLFLLDKPVVVALLEQVNSALDCNSCQQSQTRQAHLKIHIAFVVIGRAPSFYREQTVDKN